MAAATPCLSENTLSTLLSSGAGADDALERSLLHAAGCPACRRLLAATARSAVSTSSNPGAHSEPEAATAPSPSALLRRGALVGRYIVIDLCGSGGMGVVYEAYDPDLDRKVALKLLRPQ